MMKQSDCKLVAWNNALKKLLERETKAIRAILFFHFCVESL